MRSVADALRREAVESAARMSPTERLELALALGRRDVEAYSRSHGVDPRTAIRIFERQIEPHLGALPAPAVRLWRRTHR